MYVSFHIKVYRNIRTCSTHLRQWLLSLNSDMVQSKAGCEQLIEAHRKHCVRYWRHCSRHKLCGKHCFNTSYPVRARPHRLLSSSNYFLDISTKCCWFCSFDYWEPMERFKIKSLYKVHISKGRP